MEIFERYRVDISGLSPYRQDGNLDNLDIDYIQFSLTTHEFKQLKSVFACGIVLMSRTPTLKSLGPNKERKDNLYLGKIGYLNLYLNWDQLDLDESEDSSSSSSSSSDSNEIQRSAARTRLQDELQRLGHGIFNFSNTNWILVNKAKGISTHLLLHCIEKAFGHGQQRPFFMFRAFGLKDRAIFKYAKWIPLIAQQRSGFSLDLGTSIAHEKIMSIRCQARVGATYPAFIPAAGFVSLKLSGMPDSITKAIVYHEVNHAIRDSLPQQAFMRKEPKTRRTIDNLYRRTLFQGWMKLCKNFQLEEQTSRNLRIEISLKGKALRNIGAESPAINDFIQSLNKIHAMFQAEDIVAYHIPSEVIATNLVDVALMYHIITFDDNDLDNEESSMTNLFRWASYKVGYARIDSRHALLFPATIRREELGCMQPLHDLWSWTIPGALSTMEKSVLYLLRLLLDKLDAQAPSQLENVITEMITDIASLVLLRFDDLDVQSFYRQDAFSLPQPSPQSIRQLVQNLTNRIGQREFDLLDRYNTLKRSLYNPIVWSNNANYKSAYDQHIERIVRVLNQHYGESISMFQIQQVLAPTQPRTEQYPHGMEQFCAHVNAIKYLCTVRRKLQRKRKRDGDDGFVERFVLCNSTTGKFLQMQAPTEIDLLVRIAMCFGRHWFVQISEALPQDVIGLPQFKSVVTPFLIESVHQNRRLVDSVELNIAEKTLICNYTREENVPEELSLMLAYKEYYFAELLCFSTGLQVNGLLIDIQRHLEMNNNHLIGRKGRFTSGKFKSPIHAYLHVATTYGYTWRRNTIRHNDTEEFAFIRAELAVQNSKYCEMLRSIQPPLVFESFANEIKPKASFPNQANMEQKYVLRDRVYKKYPAVSWPQSLDIFRGYLTRKETLQDLEFAEYVALIQDAKDHLILQERTRKRTLYYPTKANGKASDIIRPQETRLRVAIVLVHEAGFHWRSANSISTS